MKPLVTFAVGLGLLLSGGPLSAQAARPRPSAPRPDSAAKAPPPGPIKLVYDREVFDYPATGRRDPFAPLVGDDAHALGPRFEALSLQGLIFSAARKESMALLGDPSGKVYRVRQGETVGNARVLSIERTRVVFQVMSFGAAREEVLELKRPGQRGGAR